MASLAPSVRLGLAGPPAAAAGKWQRFEPVPFAAPSRLSFRRLRQPTPLPRMHSSSVLGRYFGRWQWLFGGG
jgi:hypothetical protein